MYLNISIFFLWTGNRNTLFDSNKPFGIGPTIALNFHLITASPTPTPAPNTHPIKLHKLKKTLVHFQ